MDAGNEVEVVENFPYQVEIIKHVWIPMPDGIKLSAKLWIPRPKEEEELFPVVLEAIPYRKDDICLQDDSVRMAYIAGHGYICARLDLRGSGDSYGTLSDEYAPHEKFDICQAIQWLSELPQSDGNVGMTGISWSGFNSLQVAAEKPSALKAIITVCSTDDRYDNDVHYMGGSLLGFYMNWWGTIVHEFNLRPADPAVVGDEWRAMQMERMARNPYLSDLWLAHQRRDDYWRGGSICEDYSAIECPVLAVGGWADAYTDAIVRMVDNLTVCTKGIIGPWGHTWPERPVPGPAIGFLQECLRWWDHWLKGIDTGVENDASIRYYLQDACESYPDLSYRPGRWMQTDDFCACADTVRFPLTAQDIPRIITTGGAGRGIVSHRSPLICGTQVDTWLPMGSPIDLPSEQTPDDERSLCFDSAPFVDAFDIVGQPILHLRIASDKPQAFIFVRLCDVYPDGTSQLITRGNLNLTHRDSHEFPEELIVNRFYDVEVPLKVIAQNLPEGHCLRVAVSTNYWPWIWPCADQATISIDCTASELELGIVGSDDIALKRSFEAPQVAFGERPEYRAGDGFTSKRDYDPGTGVMSYTRWTNDCESMTTPDAMTNSGNKVTTYTIDEHEPLSARVETVRHEAFSRGDWEVVIDVASLMTCDETDFLIETTSTVLIDGEQILDENHKSRIPRDFN